MAWGSVVVGWSASVVGAAAVVVVSLGRTVGGGVLGMAVLVAGGRASALPLEQAAADSSSGASAANVAYARARGGLVAFTWVFSLRRESVRADRM